MNIDKDDLVGDIESLEVAEHVNRLYEAVDKFIDSYSVEGGISDYDYTLSAENKHSYLDVLVETVFVVYPGRKSSPNKEDLVMEDAEREMAYMLEKADLPNNLVVSFTISVRENGLTVKKGSGVLSMEESD